MKSILVQLFFRERFIGQLSALLSSLLIAWLFAKVPYADVVLTTVINLFVELPEGTVLSQPVIVSVVAGVFVWAINAVSQNFIARHNNEVLITLKAEGVYDGPLDAWIGEEAQAGIETLIRRGSHDIASKVIGG